MNNVKDCIITFNKLLNTKYTIILGKNQKTVTLNITFNKRNFFHLIGLHYLKDLNIFDINKRIVFDDILSGKIETNMIESSIFYNKIRKRVHYFAFLEKMIDSNETVFRYNKNKDFYSKIEADFFMVNNFDKNVYLFLSKMKDNDYFLRSFFPEENTDYTKNQAKWTLIYKKKIDLKKNEEIVLYDKLKT